MRPQVLRFFVAITLLSAPLHALTQVHVDESGTHTMRVGVVPSNMLSGDAAREHGIAVSDNRGVLNVVVLERRQGN